MADVSEHLDHPILGPLGWSAESSHWFTQSPLPDGRQLDVVVDPGDGDRHAFLPRAAELYQWAMKNERRVLTKAMRAELLELYNDTWRRSDLPELSAKELTARLVWQLLVVRASEVVPVEFSYAAGDLFGNHVVAIEVDDDLQFSDIDLRG